MEPLKPLDALGAASVRAAILQACYDNHRRGNHKLRLTQIEGFLERLFIEIGRYDLIMLLDDLQERGYIEFEKERNKWTTELVVGEIGILPKGRNLVEGHEKDPAVKFD